MYLIGIFVLISYFKLSQTYDLGSLMSGSSMGGASLGDGSIGDGVLDVEGICSSPGTACLDCTHVLNCVALPVGWLRISVSECKGDDTCNVKKGGCSSETVPECELSAAKFDHVCEQVGIFPDAFDCRKFHLCSPPPGEPDGKPAEHRTAMCPRHYAYDPYTAQCSVKLPYGQCEKKPVPECFKIGQSGALSESPNHYYICLLRYGYLYPQVFLCPHGWNFWGGFCRPEKMPKSPDSTTLPPSTTAKNTADGKESKINVTAKKETDNAKTADASDENATRATKEKVARVYNLFNDFGYPTDKPTTYPPDTFLADKFDLTGLDANEDTNTMYDNNYDINNSFEYSPITD